MWGINREVVACALITVGVCLFTISFVYVNEKKFHPVSTGLVRGLSVTIISYFVGRYLNIDLTFPSAHNFRWQILRNGIMVVQGLAYAWVQFYLPLPIVLTLMASSPIFTAIFDKFINGVDLNRAQIICLVVAFVGVVLTANGTYLTFLMTG